MIDDQHEKEMMRNQMLAIILMMFLVWGWFVFFMPQQSPPVDAPPADSTALRPSPSEAERTQDSLRRAPISSDTAQGQSEWPQLPPIPTQVNPAADEVSISDGALVLTFTRIGARLKQAEVLLGDDGEGIYMFALLEV